MDPCEGTVITWGAMTIKNALTESWDAQPAMESTGVNPIGIRYVLTFVGEIHTSETWLHGYQIPTSPGQGQGLAAGLRYAVEMWNKPRQHLVVRMGDDVIFDILPAAVEPEDCRLSDAGTTSQVDVAHGPKATCHVLSIAGASAAKCRFTVEFTVPTQCDEDTLKDWLSLRYWIADNVDCRTWLTTRTYHGRIRVKSKDVNMHLLAHSLVLPPKQRGFRRESIDLTESPNGLELDFRVTDREVWANAPPPATGWEGHHRVRITYGMCTAEETLSFRLWGAKEGGIEQTVKVVDPATDTLVDVVNTRSDKQYLLALAINIIEAKLHWTRLSFTKLDPATGGADVKSGGILVKNIDFDDTLEANEVSVSITIERFHAEQWLIALPGGKNGELFTLGKPLPPDVNNANPIAFMGTNRPDWVADYDKEQAYWPPEDADGWCPTASNVGLFRQALANPCCPGSLSQKEYYYGSGGADFDTEEDTEEPSGDDEESPGEDTAVNPQELTTVPSYDPKDDTSGNEVRHFDENQTDAAYQYYYMTSRMIGDTGWRAFPMGTQCVVGDSQSSFGDTVAFAQLHCPVAIREVRIHAARFNAWPQLPKLVHWVDQRGIKHVLMTHEIDLNPARMGADGRDMVYEVDLVLRYALSRTPQPGEAIGVGVLPYVSDGQVSVGIVGTVDGYDLSPTDSTGTSAGRDGSIMHPQFFIKPASLLDQIDTGGGASF